MARRPVSAPAHVKRVTTVAGAAMRKPSDQEMHDRRLFVRQLHAAGMHTSQIVSQCVEPQLQVNGTYAIKFDCKPEAIVRLITELRAELQRELEVFAPGNQAAALQRLYGDLVQLRAEVQTLRAAPKRDLSSIRAHMVEVRHLEKLIAEMEGTLKPLKVEHAVSGEVSVNMTRAIGGMTKEQMDEAVREERERLRDASSITTHAEPPEAPAEDQVQTPAPHAPVRGGHALHAPGPPSVLPGPAQAPAVRRERSSDIAARREVRSPLDPHVGEGPSPRLGISRTVAR